MNKEDLSPEQLEAFTALMAESRGNIRNIMFCNLVLLIALTLMNVAICNLYMPEAKFVVSFLTAVLMASSTNKQLIDEADRFREESQKVLNNKL